MVVNSFKKEDGYTLIEMMLVLSVLFTLTALIIPLGNTWVQTTAEEDAFKAIVAEIQSLQSYSLANNVFTKMEFVEQGTHYISSAPGRKVFSKTAMPKGMAVPYWSGLKSVEFQPDGDIRILGVLSIETNSRTFQIRFQFQRGRMIIDG
ncbi:hypothetical protein ACXYMX_06245 [Sporosarcina sp. CAU 1771]